MPEGDGVDDPVSGALTSSNGFTTNGFTTNGFTTNGFTTNGFTTNGFTTNGFTTNGFTTNGFTTNGLTFTPSLAAWFNGTSAAEAQDRGRNMKYYVGCALPAGQVVAFNDAYGNSWSWTGAMGFAPAWGTGAEITEQQGQLMTACLAAHVNTALPAPKSIQLSMRGDQPSLAVTPQELSALSTFDGVFFGNAFNPNQPSKMYLCAPKDAAPSNYTQTLLSDWGRQCYFSADGCKGMFTIVDCNAACTPGPAGVAGYPWGPTCTVDGVSYKAIAVYVPKFKMATDFVYTSTASARSCATCLGGKAATGFSTTAQTATTNGLTTSNGAGDYILDFRYANTTGRPAYLTLQVNGTTLMNGTSTKWTFPVTVAPAAGLLSIPVRLPNNAQLKLVGAGSSGLAIEAVVVRLK